MAYTKSFLQTLCGFFLILAVAEALKFDIDAHPRGDMHSERCIRNFVTKDTLVVVTATVDGSLSDGMQIDMHIKDAVGNEYAKPKDLIGEKRMAFTSHADASFAVCFYNFFKSSNRINNPRRHIELDIDIGADAKDWTAVQATEKLKPVETELRRIEEMVAEIVSEMDYLRHREQKLRDTNESTNNRVKWFAFGTMGMLVSLGVWQVVYLRAYFRCVLEIAKKRMRDANIWGIDQSILSRCKYDDWYGDNGLRGGFLQRIRPYVLLVCEDICIMEYDDIKAMYNLSMKKWLLIFDLHRIVLFQFLRGNTWKVLPVCLWL
ncbi:vesicle coat component [Ciborinia camelliae]|nr:vesicle coat component [Ciborinia camelliae]